MLRVGDLVPGFSLPMATKEVRSVADSRVEVPVFHLREHLGRGDLLFQFFPLAFTPVCTRQVCDARDALGKGAVPDVSIFGFSADTPFVNAAFAREHDLPFPILSDPNREVLPRIWKTMPVLNVGNVAVRGWMLVGPDGRVRRTWQTDDPYAWSGAPDLLRAFQPRSRAVASGLDPKSR